MITFERSGRAPVVADVEVKPTDHPDLLTVEVSGEWIGSLRHLDGKGWMALGAFAIDPTRIPDYAHHFGCWDSVTKAPRTGWDLPDPVFYNFYWEDRDKAVEALVVAWVDALANAIRHLKLRRERREIAHRRISNNGNGKDGH